MAFCSLPVSPTARRAQDGLREQRVGNVGLAPDGGDQFVASDRAFALLDEIRQAFESARRQSDDLACVPQLPCWRIQAVVAELIGPRTHAGGRVACGVHRRYGMSTA